MIFCPTVRLFIFTFNAVSILQCNYITCNSNVDFAEMLKSGYVKNLIVL